ncbi:hypothetical protein ACC783_38670, partial [Rhizobium ruizarguesonis]
LAAFLEHPGIIGAAVGNDIAEGKLVGLHPWTYSSLCYACRFPGTAAPFLATCIGPPLAAATNTLKSYFRGEAANSGK